MDLKQLIQLDMNKNIFKNPDKGNTYNSSVQLLSSIPKWCRIEMNCTLCSFKGDNVISFTYSQYHLEIIYTWQRIKYSHGTTLLYITAIGSHCINRKRNGILPLHTKQQVSGTETGDKHVMGWQVFNPQNIFPFFHKNKWEKSKNIKKSSNYLAAMQHQFLTLWMWQKWSKICMTYRASAHDTLVGLAWWEELMVCKCFPCLVYSSIIPTGFDRCPETSRSPVLILYKKSSRKFKYKCYGNCYTVHHKTVSTSRM